jgi:AcrR family transcriptional regulator
MPGKRAPEDERRAQIRRAALRVALRDRLDRLTIRAVAQEAGISTGLVFFHYTNKEALLVDMLEWLTATIIVAEVSADILAQPTPSAQLLALLRQELSRVEQQRARLELFFDYWVLGSRDPAMRDLISRALDRYRATFLPLVEAVLASHPTLHQRITADGIVALATSMIQGWTIQMIKSPTPLDPEPMLEVLHALLEPAQSPLGEKSVTPMTLPVRVMFDS